MIATSLLMRTGLRILGTLLVVVAAIYTVRAFDARRMPDLGPEHRIEFKNEFAAADEAQTDWDAYRRIEDALAAELDELVESRQRPENMLDRYRSDSLMYPGNFDGNWNRTYELTVRAPRGVALLLHGLTDSPYSMLATAQVLAGAGYDVVVPRIPGHGFAVGGLRQTHWEDWAAAVRIAARHVRQLPASEQSFIIGGYSNGALIALDYALHCDGDQTTPCPDRLVLMSPAIALSPIARVANWHAAVSWIPYFEKFGWASIYPEIDPFKFTSFPKRAGWEIYKLAARTHRLLADSERVAHLPPILAFQSVVDNTVSSAAVAERLYSKLPRNGSKLIVYDVNRNSTIVQLMRGAPPDPVDYFQSAAPLNYAVVVLHNRSGRGFDVSTTTMSPSHSIPSVSPTGYHWPQGMYSLSHIALPFRPDDPLYGDGSMAADERSPVVLGAAAPRGEIGVLLLPAEYFLRTRYNPFFAFQASALLEWLAADPVP